MYSQRTKSKRSMRGAGSPIDDPVLRRALVQHALHEVLKERVGNARAPVPAHREDREADEAIVRA
eukprot:11207768-Lingulodinium_polyedra.AAC.1